MSENVLTLKITADGKSAVAGLDKVTEQVAAMCKSVQKEIGNLSGSFEKLNTINLKGLVDQVKFAQSAVTGLTTRVLELKDSLYDLDGVAMTASRSIQMVAKAATGADGIITKLGANAIKTGDALGDVGAGAQLGADGLVKISDEALAAKDTLSGLNRVVGNTITRVEKLSVTPFDSAGIVDGANAATVALERTAVAARQVRGGVVGVGRIGGRGGRTVTAGEEGSAFSAAVGMGGKAFKGGAIAITALGGGAAYVSGKLDTDAQQILANTNATDQDIANAKMSVRRNWRMGQLDSTSSLMSYMHIINHDFKGEGAARINDFAAMAKIATGKEGGSQEDIGNAISAFMHMGKLSPTESNISRSGNVLHQAAASGNMTLAQLVKYGAPAAGKAYALGNSPIDSFAFMTALTQSANIRTPQAATNLAGITWQITHPTEKAQKAIDAAGLGDYFGGADPSKGRIAPLKKYGLQTILNKTFEAVGGDQQRMMDIFGNKQGGFGALINTSVGKSDYEKAINDPKYGGKAAWEGKQKPIEERYAQAQKTPGQQINREKGKELDELAKVGDDFQKVFFKALPLIDKVLDNVNKLLDAFVKLPTPIQEVVLAFGTFGILEHILGTFTGLAEIVPTVGKFLGPLGRAMGLVGGEAAGAGGALEALSGPIGWVVAAVAGLAVAWKTNFGGIREVAMKVVKDVTTWWKANLPEIMETVKTVTNFVQTLFKAHSGRLTAIFSALWKGLGAIVTLALHLIEDVIKIAMDIINGHWDRLGNDLKAITMHEWQAIKDLFVNAAKFIGNLVMGLAELLGETLFRVAKAAWGIGEAIINGIINGAKALWGKLTSFVSGIGQHITSTIKDKLQIHSPSKVMHEIGQNIVQGLIDGIDSKSAGVKDAMDRLAVKIQFSNAKARLGSKDRAGRARLSNEESAALTGIAVAHSKEEHAHDRFFMGTDVDLANYSAKWRAKNTDNAAYLAYLEQARQKMVEFGNAHKSWLQENTPQLREYEQLWKRINTAIQEVTGKIKAAKAEAEKVAARNERFTQRDADRIMDTRFQMGDVDAGMAMSYFQGRLAEMGKPKDGDDPAKWEAYAEVLGKIKELNNQIGESERSSVSASLGALTDRFKDGKIRVGEYVEKLKQLQEQLTIFATISGRSMTDPTIAPLMNTIGGLIAGVDVQTLRSKVADAMRYAKSGKDENGAGYTKGDAVEALKALLPLAPDQSALQTSIKNDIAALSKDTGIAESAKQFWNAFMEPFDKFLSDTIENLFKGRKQRTSGKDLLRSFGEGELGSLLKFGEGRLQQGLQGAIFGHDGKGNPLDILSGLFGGRGKGHSNGIMADYYGIDGGGKNGPFANIPNLFKGAKASMLEGAMGIFSAAQALQSVFSGGHKKKGGLFGSILGGVVGSLIPGGGWLAGVGIGGQIGNMLGFADGGMPPVGIPSIVGERGPELFVPSVRGSIVPNHMLSAMAGGMSVDASHTTHIHGDVVMQSELDDYYAQSSRRQEVNIRKAIAAITA